MVFLQVIVYFSAAAYISVEICWGSCWHIWHINISKVKGQASIQNSNFFASLCGQYKFNMEWLPSCIHGVTVYQSAAGCISGGTKVGYMLEQEYIWRVKLVKNEFKYRRKKYSADIIHRSMLSRGGYFIYRLNATQEVNFQ